MGKALIELPSDEDFYSSVYGEADGQAAGQKVALRHHSFTADQPEFSPANLTYLTPPNTAPVPNTPFNRNQDSRKKPYTGRNNNPNNRKYVNATNTPTNRPNSPQNAYQHMVGAPPPSSQGKPVLTPDNLAPVNYVNMYNYYPPQQFLEGAHYGNPHWGTWHGAPMMWNASGGWQSPPHFQTGWEEPANSLGSDISASTNVSDASSGNWEAETVFRGSRAVQEEATTGQQARTSKGPYQYKRHNTNANGNGSPNRKQNGKTRQL